jgi:hypothetical protein
MLKSKFFKLPSHRQFDYVPRYYDETKERLERQYQAIAQEMGKADAPPLEKQKAAFKDNIRGTWKVGSHSRAAYQANIRLVIVLAGMIVLFYLIYYALDNAELFAEKIK